MARVWLFADKKDDIMKTKVAFVLLALMAMMACENVSTTPTPTGPIVVSNPPDGAVLGDPITITATPGEGFEFDSVGFYIDSALVAIDSIAPFQFDWNIFELESGTDHTIFVVGFTADSSFVSELVHVRVEYERGLSFVSVYRPGSQHAIGVTNFYNVLFVSTGTDGLEVLDITNKFLPRFRSRFINGGQILRSAVLFPFVYTAENNQGVEMVDFEDVDSLISIHRYVPQSLVKHVAVSENFIFSVEIDGFAILAQSDLSTFSRRAFQDQLYYTVARHDTAFIIGDNAFYVLDCTDPEASQLVGTFDSNLNPAPPAIPVKSVAVVDTFAFITNGSDGVFALSISDPTNPRYLARFNPGPIMTSVAVGDGFLFSGSNSGGVDALSYTVADTLMSVSHFDVTTIIEEIAHSSNYLYVAANANVDILRFVP